MVTATGFRPLRGVRVIEFDLGIAQFAGRILADAGAEVIKIEVAAGNTPRNFGPFLDNRQGKDRSLNFWYYNTSKQSVVLDLSSPEGLDAARELAAGATVIIDGMEVGQLDALGLRYEDLKVVNPRLVYCAVTAFGQDGPWRDYATSDLVQLAAGGLLSVCGYDEPDGPPYPVAPTGGQSRHIVGMTAAMAVIAALIARSDADEGQFIDVSAHDSIAVSLEMGVPFWFYQQREVVRHTARHAMPGPTPRWQHRCADGKYLLALPLYIDDTRFAALVDWFGSEGMAEDLTDEKYQTAGNRAGAMDHIIDVIGRFCAAHDSATMFHGSQARRLPWAPVNAPDEILADPHFTAHRHTFVEVRDSVSGEPHLFAQLPFLVGQGDAISRPPKLGEHTDLVKAALKHDGGSDSAN